MKKISFEELVNINTIFSKYYLLFKIKSNTNKIDPIIK